MSDRLKHNANGERFLSLVISFIQQHEKEIKRGLLVFSLNPTCLMYLNAVVRGHIKVTSPKIKKQDLLDVENFVNELISLKVESNTPRLLEKHKPIDLSIFRNIRILEIDYCKPSLVTNMTQMSVSLIKLSVHNCMAALSEVLAVEEEDERTGGGSQQLSLASPPSTSSPVRSPSLGSLNAISTKCWHNLRVLDCSQNYVPRIDSSMTQLIRVEKMDLSNNLLTKVDNLQYCIYLSELSLSHNRLSSLQRVNETVGNVKILNLSHNQLESAEGLEKLYSLENLDLSHNLLKEMKGVKMLGGLPLLTKLALSGNPVVSLPNYRVGILAMFDHPIMLDGSYIVEEERELVATTRQDNAPPKKPRKVPKKRVAAIEDANLTPESEVDVDVPKKPEDDQDFKEILQIRQEMGEKWLLILNEMNKDTPELPKKNTPPASTPPKSTTTTTNTSTKPSPVSLSLSPPNIDSLPPMYSTTDYRVPVDVNNGNNKHDNLNDSKTTNNITLDTNNNGNTLTSNIIDNYKTDTNTINTNNTTYTNNTNTVDTYSVSTPTTISPVPTPTPTPTLTSVSPTPSSTAAPADIQTLSSLSLNNTPTSSAAPTPTLSPTLSEHNLLSSIPKDSFSLQPPISTSKPAVDIPEESPPLETVHVKREDKYGLVERFLELREDKVDVDGTLVFTLDIKNLHNVRDVSKEPDQAVEVTMREWTAVTTRSMKVATYIYYLSSPSEKALMLDFLTPRIKKKQMKCVNCSTVFDLLSLEGNKCTKCGSDFLVEFEAIGSSASNRLSVVISPTDIQLDPFGGKSTSVTTPTQAAATMPTTKHDISQNMHDEDLYQEAVKTDLNFQTYLKMNVFINANEEHFVYMFRTTYIKANTSMETESLIYLVLSTKGLYFLKQDKPVDVMIKQPLSRLRRVVVGLFYQLFRMEIDTNATPSTSPTMTTPFVFLPRSHYRTHKFIDTLMTTVKAMDNFDPPEITHVLRDTLYNINVCLMVPAVEVQLYVMLHFRSKFHKGLLARSLICSRERAYLCSEDYSKWPSNVKLAKTQLMEAKLGEMNSKARHEYAKLAWRRLAGVTIESRFEPQFTRDLQDVTGLQTSATGVVILFEELEPGTKENKNKPREWDLVPAHPQEQQRIVKTISALWKNLFRIDLPIESK